MIWLNGEALDDARIAFDLTDRGLLLGDGVFDTALVLGGQTVWGAAHAARLRDACTAIGIDVEQGRLRERIDEAMALAADGMALGSIRVMVTRGPGPRGIAPPPEPAPTVIASRAPMTTLPAFQPLSLWLSPVRRNDTSITSRIKNLGCLDQVLETGRARASGCDEALFLNTRGDVACNSTGNIFAFSGGRLMTPPLEAGILAGIARGAVLRLAPLLGVTVCEPSLQPEDLARADAVFVTSSLKLLAPVTRIGDAPLRQDPDLLAALRRALAEDIGLDQKVRQPG